MRNFRIGLLIGLRQIQRASIWSTTLIVLVVVLTFLNLVMSSGILSGIVDGAIQGVRNQALGDIIISPLEDETRIQETIRLTQVLDTYNEIESYSVRYSGLAVIEANYEERRDLSSDPDVIGVNITGIDAAAEGSTTQLPLLVAEGSYLDPNESGFIILGKYNVDRYAEEFGNVFDSLKDIYPGDKVMVRAGEKEREFTVKGIIDSKIDLVSVNVYMSDLDFRRLFDRDDYNANQIVLRLKPGVDENVISQRLHDSELSSISEINSFEQDIPKFIADVRETFSLLGLITGVIGVSVASITIFIIIFINAVSRRKQIGILKAIGITKRAIEYAYVTQAFVYTFIGSLFGMVLTQFLIIPYLIQNPIDFPYSDVSLSIDMVGMLSRAALLILASCVAGFVPVWMIVRQNTLDAILDRR